ncbi:hypothetical protein YB2330_004535 [Saitoella coloradoensis]
MVPSIDASGNFSLRSEEETKEVAEKLIASHRRVLGATEPIAMGNNLHLYKEYLHNTIQPQDQMIGRSRRQERDKGRSPSVNSSNRGPCASGFDLLVEAIDQRKHVEEPEDRFTERGGRQSSTSIHTPPEEKEYLVEFGNIRPPQEISAGPMPPLVLEPAPISPVSPVNPLIPTGKSAVPSFAGLMSALGHGRDPKQAPVWPELVQPSLRKCSDSMVIPGQAAPLAPQVEQYTDHTFAQQMVRSPSMRWAPYRHSYSNEHLFEQYAEKAQINGGRFPFFSRLKFEFSSLEVTGITPSAELRQQPPKQLHLFIDAESCFGISGAIMVTPMLIQGLAKTWLSKGTHSGVLVISINIYAKRATAARAHTHPYVVEALKMNNIFLNLVYDGPPGLQPANKVLIGKYDQTMRSIWTNPKNTDDVHQLTPELLPDLRGRVTIAVVSNEVEVRQPLSVAAAVRGYDVCIICDSSFWPQPTSVNDLLRRPVVVYSIPKLLRPFEVSEISHALIFCLTNTFPVQISHSTGLETSFPRKAIGEDAVSDTPALVGLCNVGRPPKPTRRSYNGSETRYQPYGTPPIQQVKQIAGNYSSRTPPGNGKMGPYMTVGYNGQMSQRQSSRASDTVGLPHNVSSSSEVILPVMWVRFGDGPVKNAYGYGLKFTENVIALKKLDTMCPQTLKEDEYTVQSGQIASIEFSRDPMFLHIGLQRPRVSWNSAFVMWGILPGEAAASDMTKGLQMVGDNVRGEHTQSKTVRRGIAKGGVHIPEFALQPETLGTERKVADYGTERESAAFSESWEESDRDFVSVNTKGGRAASFMRATKTKKSSGRSKGGTVKDAIVIED